MNIPTPTTETRIVGGTTRTTTIWTCGRYKLKRRDSDLPYERPRWETSPSADNLKTVRVVEQDPLRAIFAPGDPIRYGVAWPASGKAPATPEHTDEIAHQLTAAAEAADMFAIIRNSHHEGTAP